MTALTSEGLSLSGTDADVLAEIRTMHPKVDGILARALELVPYGKRQITPTQGAFLYAAARPFNREGARILEIGTFHGYSAALLAMACPRAMIVTLNPRRDESARARLFLGSLHNVEVMEYLSWDYLSIYRGPVFDIVWVDGDHKQIKRDLPWWGRLRVGGLMIFHDYAPDGTHRPCQPVYDALNEMSAKLGRPFDVSAIDDGGVGLVGFYKREGE